MKNLSFCVGTTFSYYITKHVTKHINKQIGNQIITIFFKANKKLINTFLGRKSNGLLCDRNLRFLFIINKDLFTNYF